MLHAWPHAAQVPACAPLAPRPSQLEPKDLAEQLKKTGAAVPAIRPGKQTAEYVTTTLTRMSVLGSVFLGVLSGAPALVEGLTGLTAFRGFAGTSVLIMVSAMMVSMHAQRAARSSSLSWHAGLSLPGNARTGAAAADMWWCCCHCGHGARSKLERGSLHLILVCACMRVVCRWVWPQTLRAASAPSRPWRATRTWTSCTTT